MSKEVVFDIETIGDIRNYADLKVTVVSVYEYQIDRFTSFDENELSALWPILENAERLIGYNSEHFDVPVLNRFYAGDLNKIPHLDLLKIIKESSGQRYKLNDIAKATLQIEKSADGLQAMKWYAEGRIDLIKQYCEQDVRITKEVYEYGRKNRMVYFPTLTGEIRPLAVNFEPEMRLEKTANSENKINLTLPF